MLLPWPSRQASNIPLHDGRITKGGSSFTPFKGINQINRRFKRVYYVSFGFHNARAGNVLNSSIADMIFQPCFDRTLFASLCFIQFFPHHILKTETKKIVWHI